MFKVLICLAAVAAVATAQICGHGKPVFLNNGFVNSLTDFPMPDPECDDVTINCDNPIDGNECNLACYKGKGGRYLPDGLDPNTATDSQWVSFPNLFYANGGQGLNVRHYVDPNGALRAALIAAEVVEVYTRCDNFGMGTQEGCLRFTVFDGTPQERSECAIHDTDPAQSITCPPAPVVLEDPGMCEFSTQVQSWTTGDGTTSSYTLSLQFKTTKNITYWKTNWNQPPNHTVVASPWNIMCHDQTDIAVSNLSTGFSYPSNSHVTGGVWMTNLGFNADSAGPLSANDHDLTSFSINDVPCLRVPWVPAPTQPPYVPEDSCSLNFVSQLSSVDLPVFPLPDPECDDTVINCGNDILATECNGFPVGGFNGRYKDQNDVWHDLGNLFYPTQSKLIVRHYLDDGSLSAALRAAKEIQVYSRCDNMGAPETSCLAFRVETPQSLPICPEGATPPAPLPPSCFEPVSSVDSCTFAYSVRNNWGNGFTIDMQFTPSNAISNWTIEWSVHNQADVVATPWNVNCWRQIGNINHGSNHPSNAAVGAGMMMSNLGYNADRNVTADPTDVVKIGSFALNGVVCTETNYMVGADNAIFVVGSSVGTTAGVAAGVAASALVVAGVALGRRLSKKPKRATRSRSASIDSSEVTKGGAINSVAHRGSVTSRNGRVA